jgi:hypothetical protein
MKTYQDFLKQIWEKRRISPREPISDDCFTEAAELYSSHKCEIRDQIIQKQGEYIECLKCYVPSDILEVFKKFGREGEIETLKNQL